MNKFSKFLFLGALSFGLWSCSADEPANSSGDQGTITDGQASFLSVSLKSSEGFTSANSYENGTEEENKVNKVRFYFFTGSGAAANVKILNGSYVNYYDWTPETQTPGTDGSNVGRKLDVTLVIETPKGDKLPAQIAAVINPTENAISRTLPELKQLTRDYATSNLTSTGKFVMFNSVYGNATGTGEICAVPIEEKHLAKTASAAKGNPVILYVERCVAKVSVNLNAGFDETTKMLALKDIDNKDLKVEGEQVYLKIHGWKLAAETTTGNLVKAINYSAWNSSDYKDWWNNFNDKRSCWAVNAPDAENGYWSYNEITPDDSDDSEESTKYDFSAPLYTNENAENYRTNNLNYTKVIMTGTLCKRDGTAFTIVRHLGSHFADTYSETEADNLPALKRNILAQLTADFKYYWKEGENYKSIATSDLKIVSVGTNNVEDTPAKDCYVYAQLTDEAKAKTWYTANTNGAAEVVGGSQAINDRLKGEKVVNDKIVEVEHAVDKALVWREGMTYYYYEIVHHTADNGDQESGVVRNHVYKTTVKKIAGLGTPVYNPDEKIYPEKPDPNDHFIAAQINVLAWHIVSDDYNLEWK